MGDNENDKPKELFKYSESQLNGNQDSEEEAPDKSGITNEMDNSKLCNGDVKSEENDKEEKEEDALEELKGMTMYDDATEEIWDPSPYQPRIEDFELVVASVEQLRELVLRFGPIPEDLKKKQEGESVPKIKKKAGRKPKIKKAEDMGENNVGEEKEKNVGEEKEKDVEEKEMNVGEENKINNCEEKEPNDGEEKENDDCEEKENDCEENEDDEMEVETDKVTENRVTKNDKE